jgi:nucleolin
MAKRPAKQIKKKVASKKQESETSSQEEHISKASNSETSSQEEHISKASNSETSSQEEVSNDSSCISYNSKEKADIEDAVKDLEQSSEQVSNESEEKPVDQSSQVEEETNSGSSESDQIDEETLRTVFMKGLDYDVRESDIREQFEKLGEIERVHIPMTHDDRRNKGFAYVGFKRLVDAKKALKLNGTTFMGRNIVVNQAQPKTNRKLYTVFVKNLAFSTKKEELEAYFNKFAKVYNLSLPVDQEHEGRNKGYCFVEYTDEEVAKKVVAAKHVFNKRNLYLNLGCKNDERNKKRESDRLYGRRNNDDRESKRSERKYEKRDSKYESESRSNVKTSNKTVFEDSD